MTTKLTAEDVIRKQTEAWNRHDSAAVAAGYTRNAVVLDPAYSEPLSGSEAIKKDAADFFAAFPDITLRVTKVLAEGDTVAFEAMVSGTHTGPLQMPTGLIPATKKRLEFSAAGFLNLDATGNIREERRYYDVAGQLTQLGVMQ